MNDFFRWALCAIIPYLLGSVSFGILLSRRQGHDIRKEGSHNTGASNALRVVGVKTGLLTFLCDVMKAALAVLLGIWLKGQYGGMLAGLMVIVGHNWPIFFQFQGGKGIACSCAVLVLNFPIPGLIAIVLCLAVIALTRYISLGSMVMLVSYCVILLFTMAIWPYGVWALLLTMIGIGRHHANIQRLLRGQENKINFKKKG
ncbi:MAG: glycerol-3-phosphate 1-O-acyltransferase PlsY [Clostridia bacterium]|nr:glycerol-3-phosphate 1-O-acyltransferase PlsY [Clostridia bacterium]